MERSKKGETTFSKIFLTCSNCGHFPLSIDNITKFSYSNEYTIVTKCPKCKDWKYKHIPKEIFDKLNLDNL